MNDLLVMEIYSNSALQEYGLLRGKMGVCLYFYEASKRSDNEQYREFADSIFDDVYNYVHRNPVSPYFDSGLLGIAWGINYLIENDFVEGDPDELLSSIDNIIYHIIENKIEELKFGFKQGLLGYVFYLLSRMSKMDKNPIKNFKFF